MVNANVVISVSAVLVALILTIVVVMRQDGDPTDNFSVSVTGSYAHADGNTYEADMYYCIAQLTDSWAADNTFTLDLEGGSGTFTMATYALNDAPATDTPSVRGKTVPTIAACQALWDAANDAACPDGAGNCGGDKTIDEADEDENAAAEDLSVLEEGGRKLWSSSVNAYDMSKIASYGYKVSNGLPGGWAHWGSCVNINSVARFAYKWGHSFVLSYAGTDDVIDALQDLKIWGHHNYHGGFYDYVMATKGCVDSRIRLLNGWGYTINYITGHSLGGAAATVYQQLAASSVPNIANAKVVTYGAPKTSKNWGCKSRGTRIYNQNDPVASNVMGILSDFNHDVKAARQVYSTCCGRNWWGTCTCTRYSHRGTGCGQAAGGCSWFFDCIWHVGNHGLSTYQKHNLHTLTV